MINKLRRRFILIAMASLAAVLILMIGTINLSNFHAIGENAERLIELINQNGGKLPDRGNQPVKPSHSDSRPPHLSPETPFNTRYFTVTLSAGEVLSADIGMTASMDEASASALAKKLDLAGRTVGYYKNFRYRAFTQNGGTMYIFLDCEREMATFRTFLIASISISLVGFLAVFFMVLFLSELAMRPIADSISKQKRFITDAGHELKTPLSVILADTDLLELEAGENEWTRSIRRQAGKLQSLTERLVFLSRMEEAGAISEKKEFSLSRTVADTAEPFFAVAQAKGKHLESAIEPDITLCGDEAAIERLISILLDNAMKYASEGSTVHLSLKREGKGARITMVNAVDSIGKGSQDRLFERFWRRDEARSTQGFGIGLSSARAIVTAHGGKIEARSDDSKSIRFEIEL